MVYGTMHNAVYTMTLLRAIRSLCCDVSHWPINHFHSGGERHIGLVVWCEGAEDGMELPAHAASQLRRCACSSQQPVSHYASFFDTPHA